MCIGADDGCQVVPDPNAPMEMMFVLLEPTRIPMSLPFMTINGPMFIEPVPGMFFMPFIPPISPGKGPAIGIGIFIFCSGEACGFGEEVGTCIPGIFTCVCGDGEGDAWGGRIPGIFICVSGDGEGEAWGICIPGMFICICRGERCGAADCFGDDLAAIFIPGMLSISFLFAALSCAG